MVGKTSRAKLTKRTVEAAQADPSGEVRVWDTELRGYCLRVWPTGRRVYALKYRVGARQRWFTIGEHGSPWKAETARDRADELLQGIRLGTVDPAAHRQERRHALTVSDLIDLYVKEGPNDRPNKRASSWTTDRLGLEHHVKPLLGARIARELRPDDIAQWQANVIAGKTARVGPGARKRGRLLVRGGRGAASRVVTSFAAMLAWGMRKGLLDRNPAAHQWGMEKVKSGSRDRFLTDAEAQALRLAVDELEKARPRGLKPHGREYGAEARPKIPEDHADAVRLLMLTGARRGEILGLRWSEVDLPRGLLVLPPSRHKSGGAGKQKPIALPTEAVAILAARSKRGAYIFPDASGKKPLVTIKRSWAAIIARAKLPGLRLHDLRHSFASFAVADGAPLYLVGKSLGHAKASTTERYAHLRDEAMHRVAEGVSRRWARQIGNANADIVTFSQTSKED